MSDEHTPPAVTYATYLKIEELLSLQQPRSSEHDEVLFIVIHQVSRLRPRPCGSASLGEVVKQLARPEAPRNRQFANTFCSAAS